LWLLTAAERGNPMSHPREQPLAAKNESPAVDAQRGLSRMSLESLLEPIMSEAAATRQRGIVRIGSEITGLWKLRLYDRLCEYWARGEREERQSCDHGFHFRSPLFDWNTACYMTRPGLEIMSCLLTRAFGRTEYSRRIDKDSRTSAQLCQRMKTRIN
jgi:hypothetical protein